MTTIERTRTRGSWISRTATATVDAAATALALGTAAGLVLDALRPGSAIHPLWMGSTGARGVDAAMAAAFAALVLLARPIRATAPRASRIACGVVGATVAGLSARALVLQWLAFADGTLLAAAVVPPTTLVALAVVVPWTVRNVRSRADASPGRRPAVRAAAVVVAAAVLVFAQIEAVGATDYRAPADAILVLGSKVNADGSPSGSLLDRTRTACALWRDGLAPVLVLSGGRGAGAPVGEPEAMREIALAEGVPDSALILDDGGADTASSVRFSARLARERAWRRVLVVSHDYHLARVRLLAEREGLVVRTVPAAETCASGWKARAVVREWAAYLATLTLAN